MALPCQPNCGVNGQEMFVVRNRGVGEESGSQSSDTGFATADKRGATPALSGKYEDPQHPGMARKVSKSGKFVFISGADEDGSKFKLSGSIEGRVLTVDFSPKGGPTDLQAVAGFSPKDGSIILKFPVRLPFRRPEPPNRSVPIQSVSPSPCLPSETHRWPARRTATCGPGFKRELRWPPWLPSSVLL